MSNHPTVYLAGPITGLSYGESVDWREYATTILATQGIKGLSPMRAKDHLKGIMDFTSAGDPYKASSVISSNRGIMTRDRWDATRCDVILANLLGAKTVSIGTVMEIAWADKCRVPIVCAMESEGNLHEHGMISEAIGFRVTTLDEALHAVKALLL